MSNTKTITKFESLPNEIFIECFQYLNATDIFYSFDQLNYRFYRLIRNIPLYLNLKNVQKFMFDQFCNKILINSGIKSQIYSLYLSNTSIYNQIHTFLSLFPLDQFSHLQSLSLNELDEYTIQKFIQMIPSLYNLRYFHFMNCSCEITQMLVSLTTSTIQTLSIPKLELIYFGSINQFTSIVSLVIFYCYIEKLCQFFKYFPRLKYLHIEQLRQRIHLKDFDLYQIDDYVAIDLKHLIINHSIIRLDFLEILFKKTPNLKTLFLYIYGNIELIDACRWQQLITSLMPRLKIFNFLFNVSLKSQNDILNKCQSFQNDFWHEKYHWYTDYETTNHSALIYTTPYLSNDYTLYPNTKKYHSKSISNFNTYNNVTTLRLYLEALIDFNQDYFDNVKSLILTCRFYGRNHTYLHLKIQDIEYLKMIMNLYNLTHLEISLLCRLESPLVLLKLLKEAPNILSLKIHDNSLFSSLDNQELCKYLNKTIKKLDVSSLGHILFCDNNKIIQFGQIFSNIQQLRCDINDMVDISFLFNALSKLPNFNVFFFRTNSIVVDINCWIEDCEIELDTYSFAVKYEPAVNNIEYRSAYRCLHDNDDSSSNDYYCSDDD
ncbi:unnamed protein product [Rotaria sp. Silwood2]|nr:unnamed protein product [Rotaria sp. Silwood2]CAF4283628.1 unnamed protein product [Rotaria sp. Silwood2]